MNAGRVSMDTYRAYNCEWNGSYENIVVFSMTKNINITFERYPLGDASFSDV